MNSISQRLSRFKPSLTVKITQKAREMRNAGKTIISLSSGEPDFDTPSHIKKKAKDAIDRGFTKYTQVDGIIELKKAISKKFELENNIYYDTNQITVGVGGKHVIYNLFMCTLEMGDEVVIPSPYWVSYPDIVSLCNGKPVIIETEMDEGFKISPSELKKAISKNTRWFILNSPGNPTGSLYTFDELRKISEILLKFPHVNILSDDIYEHIIYNDKKFYNILNVEPSLYDRLFIVNGVSKAFSMTGWRIGYGAGSSDIIKAIAKIQSQSTTNPCSISQVAACHALESKKDFLKDWIIKFSERKDFLLNFFNNVEGLIPFSPDGAFYLYVSCQGFMNKKDKNGNLVTNDLEFCEYLLENAGVALVPGIAFGKSPFFRISYATSMNDLKLACSNIKNSLENFS